MNSDLLFSHDFAQVQRRKPIVSFNHSKSDPTQSKQIELTMLDNAIQILNQLVAFNTVSSNSNLNFVHYVESFLNSHGVRFKRIPNDDGSKASLFATIGPEGNGGVCFSGHSDVVPVANQQWNSDPFTLFQQNGQLFGRGTCDMKGFLACVMAVFASTKDKDLHKPVHFVFSYDEEVGCAGVLPTVQRLGRDLPMPDWVVVGEPTMMEVVAGHKGIHSFSTQVFGHAGHSSKPHLALDALEMATSVIGHLYSQREELRQKGDPDKLFDPPFSTLHVGVLRAGEARNIVADFAEMQWEVRAVRGFEPEQVLLKLQDFCNHHLMPDRMKLFPEARVETKKRETIVPMFTYEPDSLAVKNALNYSGLNSVHTVPYGTEAGHFQHRGIPTVIIGPGSIDQAHAPNEFVTSDQLARCLTFLERVALG